MSPDILDIPLNELDPEIAAVLDGELARQMIRETELTAKDFIYPLFVKPGTGRRDEIPSMPGVYQVSLDMLMGEMLYTSGTLEK